MIRPTSQSGFSLVELLVAALIFTFVVMGVSQLFSSALNLQRRASGFQRIQENALFVIESISRTVRVSDIVSADTTCTEAAIGDADELVLDHPDYDEVVYRYEKTQEGRGYLTRTEGVAGIAETITADEVDITQFAFCISGSDDGDDRQARVTIPMTIKAVSSQPSARVEVSLQTTIVSRDLVGELTN